MAEHPSRRKFMIGAGAAGVAVGASACLPGEEKTRDGQNIETVGRYQFLLSSELTTRTLEDQKTTAVNSLVRGIPSDPELDHLREHARSLPAESQMSVPNAPELRTMISKSRNQLAELAGAIEVGSHGLFVFADADSQMNRNQCMYVIKRESDTHPRFEKKYLVSLASEGFGFEEDSGKTPPGLHSVHSSEMGTFGEIVSGISRHADEATQFRRFARMFKRVYVPDRTRSGGRWRWYVNDFGNVPERALGKRRRVRDIAEVVTDQYLLHGPRTRTSRAIRIHGTNRSGTWIGRVWQTFLGGRRQSGGCIRMSNTDVRDLGLSRYIGRGTSVYIHATPAAIQAVNHLSEEEIRALPPAMK